MSAHALGASTVQIIARALDGWTLAALGVVAFGILEQRCRRPRHWQCAIRVLGPIAAAAVLAALTPGILEAQGPPTQGPVPSTELPSHSAAVAAAAAVILVTTYGCRALGFVALVAFAVATWIVAETTSRTALGTGLLIGAGTGMLVHAFAGSVLGSRGDGTNTPSQGPYS